MLFRGGKEKLIREIFINDDMIEAIISLPPGLFYGTGIPACVIVANKNKPDALRGKVLFINADRIPSLVAAAGERAARALTPFLSTAETARAGYEKAIAKLNERSRRQQASSANWH